MQTKSDIPPSSPDLFFFFFQAMDDLQKHIAIQFSNWEKAAEKISAIRTIDWSESQSQANECIDVLLQRGWFISSSETPLAAIFHMANLVRKELGANCDEWMANHFSSLMPTIEKEIEQKFPARLPALKEAFDAHSQEKYYLSVPVILAQADGIGTDIFGVSPYSRKTKSTETLRQWVEDNLQTWEKNLPHLGAIAGLLPINRSTKVVDVDSCLLNRHAVLHGLSSDYGTRVNSCKALSWLLFVSDYADYRIKTSAQPSAHSV